MPSGDSVAQQISQGLHKVALAIKTNDWSQSAKQQLSPTQAQVLSVLHTRGPQNLSQVAEQLAVTRATASDAVTTLAAKGLVEKARAPDDGRAVVLHVTAAGRSKAAATTAWPDLLAAAIDALSGPEQVAFHRGLVKMIRTLQEQRRIPVAHMCVNCRYFRPGVHANPEAPHHCDFVDAAFGDATLRIDCPDFETAAGSHRWDQWVALTP
ncbi:MAG: winged helix-turn-helix transcriptional regulator [Bryobacterales bacterium]|nr:winged helix-turn-helix transcriptional regulator [Bryobacterales bacterium]